VNNCLYLLIITSAIVLTSGQQCQVSKGAIIGTSHIDIVTVTTYDLCCQACLKQAGCIAWTFDNTVTTANCYLKDNVNGNSTNPDRVSGTTGATCTTDDACALNGGCKNGTCVCDPPWTSYNCSVLNFLPALKKGGEDLLTPNQTSSWCGTTTLGGDGLYHYFFSRMANHCGLMSWQHNSEIWHATGTSPTGPWLVNAARILTNFSHGPHIVRGPASEGSPYLLYHIGDGNPGYPTMYCTNGSTPQECISDPTKCYNATYSSSAGPQSKAGSHWMGILVSNDLNAPAKDWKQIQILGQNLDGTNPSAYVFENGTALLAYRYNDANPDGTSTERIGLARASHWSNNYTILHQPLFPQSWAVDEDPFIWRDKRSNFHMLLHHFHPQGGWHAFSRDGVTWTYGGLAYDMNVLWDDGTTMSMKRRERPELIFNADGVPSILFTAVEPNPPLGDFSFGMVQPLKLN